MKAIQVKYLPATNFKPSRIKAWIEGGESITQSRNYDLSDYDNACECAYSLALRLNWNVKMRGGSLPNGDTAFIIIETNCSMEVI